MSKSFSTVIDGLDLDQIDIDDQGFYEDDYEVECYYDVREYNGPRTDYTGDLIVEGSTINPFDFFNENGDLIQSKFDSAIRRQIEEALDNEDRVGPVYVIC